MHRQRIARQREEDNQRRAQERTMRLLSHLRQQEIERKRRYVCMSTYGAQLRMYMYISAIRLDVLYGGKLWRGF